MKHLIILIYLFALTTGMGMIVFITVFYFRLKINYLKYYILFLWAFFLYIAFNLFRTYIVNIAVDVPIWVNTFSLPLHYLFIPSFMSIVVMFMHDISQIRVALAVRFYFILMNVYYACMIIIPFIAQKTLGGIYSMTMSLFGSYQHFIVFSVFFVIHGIILTVLYRKLKNLYIKSTLRWFFIASVVFSLGSYLVYFLIFKNSSISNEIRQLIDISLMFTLYYLIFNIANFIYFLVYIFSKSIKDNNTDFNHFTDHYSISQGEKNVLKLTLQDMSYQEIADRLFLSPRTVESHLYRIYKKTNTSNRKELILLFEKQNNH